MGAHKRTKRQRYCKLVVQLQECIQLNAGNCCGDAVADSVRRDAFARFVHASSQHVVGAVLEDTASSVRDKRHIFGSSAIQSFVAPNSAFSRWPSQPRGHSTSPVS